ncbi:MULTISPECIES: hypothetical protein [Thermus]|uniref:hypothetical protein n=2 Tax=Thermus TaxID=270 RepID=UPI001F32BA77|nr:hypothetical protein [Thermus brockianus]
MRWLWPFLLLPALGQGWEAGVYGLGPAPTFFLRFSGELGEGVRVSYALAPYLREGEGGLSLERLYLVAEEGEWRLLLGRFPLTLGEGRLFPYTWNAPSPTGGEEGVWGGALTWYGPWRLRLGYAWDRGGFLEAAWPEVRVWLEREGGGVAGSVRLGEAVAYGEGRLGAGGPFALVGATLALGEGMVTLEGTYPWGGALGAVWPLEGLRLAGALGYGAGWWGSLALEGEEFWVRVGWGSGVWTWGMGFRGEF